MHNLIRYLSHPQVDIDPNKDIDKWSLNALGRQRVNSLAASNALAGTTLVISSAETKAVETAEPLAEALKCNVLIREGMHENDRSATGFLPPEEFERVADQFFASPHDSIRGWETAAAARRRIVKEVSNCIDTHKEHNILFVGHGGVGTLLFCALAGVPIDRKFDQGPGGGGCYFEFASDTRRPTSGWRPIEELSGTFK